MSAQQNSKIKYESLLDSQLQIEIKQNKKCCLAKYKTQRINISLKRIKVNSSFEKYQGIIISCFKRVSLRLLFWYKNLSVSVFHLSNAFFHSDAI